MSKLLWISGGFRVSLKVTLKKKKKCQLIINLITFIIRKIYYKRFKNVFRSWVIDHYYRYYTGKINVKSFYL